jgi:response regulator RpfG family c-di-GMP phosphodiesterase
MLYDIGSIPLTDKEMQAQFTVETRKNHYAGELLKEMPGLEEILPAIVQYRERWDGSGSPEGKKGREIHPLAQVLGLAFEFDELLAHGGPNFTNLPEKEALIKIMETAGKKFDPDTVKAFLVAYRRGKVDRQEAGFFEAPL